jgi:hypothetical protein
MAIQQRMRIPFRDVFPPAFPGVPSCSFFVPSGRLLGAWSGAQAAEMWRLHRSETCGAGRGNRI